MSSPNKTNPDAHRSSRNTLFEYMSVINPHTRDNADEGRIVTCKPHLQLLLTESTTSNEANKERTIGPFRDVEKEDEEVEEGKTDHIRP
jgi:hypothetical protein